MVAQVPGALSCGHMLIYTVVASVLPSEHGGSGNDGAPLDILSGGPQHDVLASYAWFQFSGNFADMGARLIDALPRRASQEKKPTKQKRSKDRQQRDVDGAQGRGDGVQRFRYQCDPYFFNQLVTRELLFLCMTDQFSSEAEVFEYLEIVKDAVLAAFERMAGATVADKRRAASLALVESLSRFTPSAPPPPPAPPYLPGALPPSSLAGSHSLGPAAAARQPQRYIAPSGPPYAATPAVTAA
ncbi:unnamed protein product, partial [Phaeothamnion confervicola]